MRLPLIFCTMFTKWTQLRVMPVMRDIISTLTQITEINGALVFQSSHSSHPDNSVDIFQIEKEPQAIYHKDTSVGKRLAVRVVNLCLTIAGYYYPCR